MKDTLNQLRKEYSQKVLRQQQIDPDPIKQFNIWFAEALNAALPEPSAMSLATVNEQGQPSVRIVLLKGVTEQGFVFYTNYQSKKGKSMAVNSAVCLNFFWPELERQVRIEGPVEKVSEEESDLYFKSRPRGSQIGAWASAQSEVIADRRILEQQKEAVEKKYDGQEVPRPQHWGGYLVTPRLIEFWQGRPGRLHDRICYQWESEQWHIKRVAP